MSDTIDVTLESHGITVAAKPANDKSAPHAIKLAREDLANGMSFKQAMVDSTDGLLLVGPDGNRHYDTPSCGDDEEDSRATAEILAMNNFGSQSNMMDQVGSGGDSAAVTISR